MATIPIAAPAVQAPPQVVMPAYVAPPAPVQNPMAQPGMAPTVDTNAIVAALMGAYQNAQGALAHQGPGVAADPQALDTIRAVPSVLGRLGATGAVTPADAMSYTAQSNRTQEQATAEQNAFNAGLAGAEAGYAGKIYGANTALSGKEFAGKLGYVGAISRAQIAAQQAKEDTQQRALASMLVGNQNATARIAGETIPYAGMPQYAAPIANAFGRVSQMGVNNIHQLIPQAPRVGGLPTGNIGG